MEVRALAKPPQIHDRAGDRASLISIDRDPHAQPLAEVARRGPRVPHDVAHAHPVRARPLRLRIIIKVEAPRRRPLAWDLHIVGALALRRHARRGAEDVHARMHGFHLFRLLVRLPGARVRVRGGRRRGNGRAAARRYVLARDAARRAAKWGSHSDRHL